MKKFKGYFLYYVRGVVKQHNFRGATKLQVLQWKVTHYTRGKDFIGEVIRPEVDDSTPLHLGW